MNTKEEAKKMFQRDAMVIVILCRLSDTSKCQHRGCKKIDHYGICIGAHARLSTLTFNCCFKHLPNFVDKAIIIANKQWRSNYAQWCKDQKKKAREVLTPYKEVRK